MAAVRETSPQWKTTIIVSSALQFVCSNVLDQCTEFYQKENRTLFTSAREGHFSLLVGEGLDFYSWGNVIFMKGNGQMGHETCRQLSAQQHRIRFSDSVETGVFVFPLSGTAFLLVDPEDLPEPFEEFQLIERIKKFVQVHRNCFLLLHDPFNGKKDLQTLIQNRFFGSNLRLLPVHSHPEIVKGMLTIAKATSKPHVDSIQDRMCLARAAIIETSPVWEMLREML